MLELGLLGLANPWLLTALLCLPVLWWLLRIIPPAPKQIRFPAMRFLLGLEPEEETSARTPLWLLILRLMLASPGDPGAGRAGAQSRAGAVRRRPAGAGGRRRLGGRARLGQADRDAGSASPGRAQRQNREVILLGTAPIRWRRSLQRC